MTEDEMVGWHHQLDGHEFAQPLGDGERQESLAWVTESRTYKRNSHTGKFDSLMAVCIP